MKTQSSFPTLLTTTIKRFAPVALTIGLATFTLTASTTAYAQGPALWQVADVVGGGTPFAIGHRGFGTNLGEDAERPIENTVEAVRDGFRSGVSMVEVDVQLTQDGHAVVFHDDILADGTCINTLTMKQLRRVAREVPTLTRILQTARPFTRRHDGPSGIVDIEIKAPSPQCDPNDEFDAILVDAVVADVDEAGMRAQVLIESFSPAVVAIAAAAAPDIARALSVNVLQFLSSEQIEAATGWQVDLIDKDAGFGLQWANIGGLFRLPGYDSPQHFAGIALAMGSTAVDLDIRILQQAEQGAPGSGGQLVGGLQAAGLSVWSFTVADQAGWDFLSATGIDGIFIDDVALGAALQGR
jgi:glycerophosphoryl diester phosphodiesterase